MIQNAIIDDAQLEIEDHGLLTCWLSLNYGGAVQGFGGYLLYSPSNSEMKSYAGYFIYRIFEVVDVRNWNDLKGKPIRVDQENNKINGIGHIIKDRWFYPDKEFS